jgi:hypothetical protein
MGRKLKAPFRKRTLEEGRFKIEKWKKEVEGSERNEELHIKRRNEEARKKVWYGSIQKTVDSIKKNEKCGYFFHLQF